MHKAKDIMKNILVTTALSNIMWAIIFSAMGREWMFVNSVYYNLVANILIHAGLVVTAKFESPYLILELLLDIVWTSAVVLAVGRFVGWTEMTPPWLFVLIVVVVHVCAMFFNMSRTKKDSDAINALISRRRNKKTKTANE